MNIKTELKEENKNLTEQIEVLTQQLKRQETTISQMKVQINELLKRIYGRKSEKIDPNQLVMNSILEEARGQIKDEEEQEKAEKKQIVREHERKIRKGRVPIPPDIERIEHRKDLREDEKTCKQCGEVLKSIGEDITERIDYIPARLIVNRYIRVKYVCGNSKSCEGCGVKQPEAEEGPINRSQAESGLLAQIIVEKYEHHDPLYRQEIRYQRQGLEISRKTMSEWMAKSAYVLKPLYNLMKKKILEYDIVMNDDTPIGMQEKGRGKLRTSRLWCSVGGEKAQYRLYNFTRTREREGPEEFFKGYKGYLMSDAYVAYEGLKEDIALICCWAHARRYFVKAQSTSPREASEILVLIAQLYKIESEHKNSEIAERLKARQTKSINILNKLKEVLKKHKQNALPKSPLGEGIDYTLRIWDKLSLYTRDGRLPIDNNLVEQAIRPVALGRKNWLFVGSENGGTTAAILLSFCTTCRKLKINTWEYLRDVLKRINDHPMNKLEDLLPDKWLHLRNNKT